MKNFYTYTKDGQRLHGYARKYKKQVLRKRGFVTKGEAESSLREAMSNIDAALRGEIRVSPTTAQEALDIYKRNLEVRSKDKGHQYLAGVGYTCKQLQTFVDRFGPSRYIRECTETDLREFYQSLCFRLSKNSAGTLIGSLQGMLKAAQKAKPDLVTWLRPTLKVSDKTEFERRVVEPWEYATLVQTLLNPPRCRNHYGERCATWRDAGDAVQLLRLTGGRLNEVVRLRLDQIEWSKGTVLLYASKTETERRVPLVGGISRLIQARIREGLTSDEFVFAGASYLRFDTKIAKACRDAARAAGLNYGRANGFTCHSLRHTFITDLILKTRDIAGTMRLSGHKSLNTFSNYLHLLDSGYTQAAAVLESVDPFLIPSAGNEGQQGHEGRCAEPAKVLQIKQVAV